MRRVALTCAAAVAFGAAAAAGHADGGRPSLPPETLRGPAYELEQYPTTSLAAAKQRAAAVRLLAEMREAATLWRDPARAAAAGYDLTTRKREPGDTKVGILHAEHRGYRHDGRQLDPRRPETLVYANVPGRPLVLIGVMFSMPRGKRGPTPGGPITRWHSHWVCSERGARGRTPRADGTCPPGAKRILGSEMLHVWFTRDLRSAFAIHAPEPELCAAGLFPADHCRRSGLICSLR